MILDAHGWPQWDVWILPFYLFAALVALKNRWFWCGCLLALGAMFKGQLLFVVPFFVLLATMPKTMGECVPHAGGVHGNRSANSFTMASANDRGLGRVLAAVAGATVSWSSCGIRSHTKARGSPELPGAPPL